MTHFPMSDLIVISGSFNRIYVKPISTSSIRIGFRTTSNKLRFFETMD
jgi:hypothetical protein